MYICIQHVYIDVYMCIYTIDMAFSYGFKSRRAMAGYDLMLVFWPERASEISVWVEPISAGPCEIYTCIIDLYTHIYLYTY